MVINLKGQLNTSMVVVIVVNTKMAWSGVLDHGINRYIQNCGIWWKTTHFLFFLPDWQYELYVCVGPNRHTHWPHLSYVYVMHWGQCWLKKRVAVTWASDWGIKIQHSVWGSNFCYMWQYSLVHVGLKRIYYHLPVVLLQSYRSKVINFTPTFTTSTKHFVYPALKD